MEITLTTPSLLFPAISLLLLAYTNRYIAIANVIRNMSRDYRSGNNQSNLVFQMKLLHKRIEIVRRMQATGIGSLILASLSMFLIFADQQYAGKVVFGASLGVLIISMMMSFYETTLSNKALTYEIDNILRQSTAKNKD